MKERQIRKALAESLKSIITTTTDVKDILESIKKEYNAGDPMKGFSKKPIEEIMAFRSVIDKYSMEYIEKAIERSEQLVLNIDNALKRIEIKEAKVGDTTKPVG